MSSPYSYVGTELDLFSTARRWKSYLREQIAPFVAGDVLEVGAGIGATTRALSTGRERSWTCLEPDTDLSGRLKKSLEGSAPTSPAPVVISARTEDIPRAEQFDTVLYIDVLEHIDDDRGELERASALLRPGGTLVVLSPAHQWLFSPFDRAIGHCRRYDRPRLLAAAPPGLPLVRLRYLDSVGLLASAGNRFLLRSASPGAGQVRFWDGVMVPCSRVLDRLFAYRLGKSILAVWTREGGGKGTDPETEPT